MPKKFIFYLKNFNRTIVMTDQDTRDLESDSKILSEVLSGNKVCTFQTEEDCLIIRPSEISAILLSSEKDKRKRTKSNEEPTLESAEKEIQALVPDLDLGDLDNDEIPSDILLDEEATPPVEDVIMEEKKK
jgi:hypothetical protein